MDGCSTFHFAQLRIKRFISLALTLALTFVAFQVNAAEQPLPASKTDIALAHQQRLTTTIQVAFPGNMFDHWDNVFSQVFPLLPVHFSNLKLNTIGRELHMTVAYLDNLSLEEASQLYTLLKNLDQKTLEEYDLLKPVKLFDPLQIKLGIHGTKSKFLGIIPHAETKAWLGRVLKLFHDKAPWIFERHLQHGNIGKQPLESFFNGEGAHLSLVQWGDRFGIDLTTEQEEQLKKDIHKIIQKAVLNHIDHNGEFPEIILNLRKTPLSLVTAPTSIQSPPTPIFNFTLDQDNVPRLSDIIRWKVSSDSTLVSSKELVDRSEEEDLDAKGFSRIVEFSSDLKALEEFDSDLRDVVGNPRYTPHVDLNEFNTKISSVAKEAFQMVVKKGLLSPTKYPATVATNNPNQKDKFYLTSYYHPNLAPERAFHLLEQARKLNVASTSNAAIGLGVYASSLQEHVLNPADTDLVINSLIRVPDSIPSVEGAEKFTAHIFTREVLEQFIEPARRGQIAFTELRIGSDATLGLPIKDVIAGYEENPYLSHQDILNGKFRYKTGQVLTIEEMVYQTKDFIKGKADLFLHDNSGKVIGRVPLSLQFLTGFLWRGNVYYFQRQGLKGVPTLMRTAVYDGAESFAVAASLSRAKELYTVQMGSIMARAIRDMMKAGYSHSQSAKENPPVLAEPLWTPKFTKIFLRFLVLVKQSETRLDRHFFLKVKEILKKEDRWESGYNLDILRKNIVDTFNQPAFKLLNLLRRNINDFSELNARGQEFTPDQLTTRLIETRDFIKELRSVILNSNTLQPSVEFHQALIRFEKLFSKLSKLPVQKAIYLANSPRIYSVFADFEEELYFLEDRVMTRSLDKIALTEMDKRFIQTFVGYAPHLYHEYLDTRSPVSEFNLKWDLRYMGIEPNETNIQNFKSLLRASTQLTREEFAKIQGRIFNSPTSTNICENALTHKK